MVVVSSAEKFIDPYYGLALWIHNARAVLEKTRFFKIKNVMPLSKTTHPKNANADLVEDSCM